MNRMKIEKDTKENTKETEKRKESGQVVFPTKLYLHSTLSAVHNIGGAVKDKKLKQIIEGEKTSIKIKGYIYEIEILSHGEVILCPQGGGSNASSATGWDNYGYTHGGEAYRTAVDTAQEIEEAYRKEKIGSEI